MRKLSDESGLTKLGDGFKNAGQKVTGFLKSGIKWTAAFGAGIAALGLKGGFERALNIEDARAQLGALGHDTAKIDGIMQNALASVKGTAFGLGDAATLAGQAVAAGVKPGEDLERQLKLVTNTAAMAKTGMGEMGSIFQKVWTAGKVGTEELNQLADRGIPIWSKLAEHYGVSADELRKMVSSGKVDAETFAGVLETTVGPAGEAMGNTTRGAFNNMMAALSRAGESFLTGIFPLFKEGMGGITGLLDQAAPYAEKAGAALAGWMTDKVIPAIKNAIPVVQAWIAEMRDRLAPVISDLKDRWDTEFRPALEAVGDYIVGTIIPAFEDFAGWLDEHRDKIAAATIVVGAFVGGLMAFDKIVGIIKTFTGVFGALNAVMAANPVGLIVGAIAALVAGLVWFFTQTETGKQVWETVWTFIKDTAAAVSEWFTTTVVPVLQAAWDAIMAAAEATAEWFNTTVVPLLQAAWDAIMAAAEASADWYLEYVAPIFDAAGELIAVVAQKLSDAWEVAWGKVKEIWDVIGEPVMSGISVVIEAVQTYWGIVWNTIVTVLKAAWDIIKSTVETALQNIESVIRIITAALQGDWSTVWSEVRDIASRTWEWIEGIVETAVNAVRDVVTNVVETLRDKWEAAWDAVKKKVGDAWEAIRSAVERKGEELLDWFRGLPDRIRGALGNLGSILANAGRDLIDGFVGSIKDGFNKVRETLGNLTDLLPSWKGPASRDKTILRDAGSLIIEGFISGLESQYGNVKRSLTGLTREVSSTAFEPMSVDVRGGARTTSGGASGGSSGQVTHVNLAAGAIQITTAAGTAEGILADVARELPAFFAQRA
nr:tape measure protein [Tessaracoccus sp. MC1865]